MLSFAAIQVSIDHHAAAAAKAAEREQAAMSAVARNVATAWKSEIAAADCLPTQPKKRARLLRQHESAMAKSELANDRIESARADRLRHTAAKQRAERRMADARAALAELRDAAKAFRESAAAGQQEQPTGEGWNPTTLTEAQAVAIRERLKMAFIWDTGAGRGKWTPAEARIMLEDCVDHATELLFDRSQAENAAAGILTWTDAAMRLRGRCKGCGWRFSELSGTGDGRNANRKPMPGKSSYWAGGINPATVAMMADMGSIRGTHYGPGRPWPKTVALDPQTVAEALVGGMAEGLPTVPADAVSIAGGAGQYPNYHMEQCQYTDDNGQHHMMRVMVEGRGRPTTFPACVVRDSRPAPLARFLQGRSRVGTMARDTDTHPVAGVAGAVAPRQWNPAEVVHTTTHLWHWTK